MENTLRTNLDWIERFSGIEVDSNLYDLLDRVVYTNIDSYNSGGSMYHLFFHLRGGKILAVHLSDFSIELSHDTWESIDAYLSSDDEAGFGWEFKFPEYEARCLWDYASEVEFENLLEGHLA